MSIFPSLNRTHVLLISGEQAIAGVRIGKAFHAAAQFEATREGFAAFARYWTEAPRLPLYVVADLIEEDFRNETVPHALGSDHRALVERKFAQFFHNTVYRCARRQGREPTGRRDDLVLFSALTNNEYLSSWIDPVLAAKIPLAGITSAAQLSEVFARCMLGKDAAHLLLVSHQPHSGLRQTYLRQGQLKFSRLTPYIPRPEPGRQDPLIDSLVEECRRTRLYLERQRSIRNDEALDIHVYGEPEDLDRFAREIGGPPLQRFFIHDLVAEACACGIPSPATASGVFTRCLLHAEPSGRLPNHYAPQSAVRYQRVRRLRQGLAWAAGFLVAVTGLTVFPLFSGGVKDLALTQSLQVEALAYRNQYDELRRNFPAVPVPAEAMRQTVDMIDTLRRVPSPLHLMARVSQVLNNFPEIQLQRFSWQAQIAPSEGQDPSAQPVHVSASSSGTPDPNQAMLAAMLAGKSSVTAILEGMIHPFTGQRAAHERLNRLIAELEAIPGLNASLVEVPLETGSDATVKTRLGEGAGSPAFSIRIETSLP